METHLLFKLFLQDFSFKMEVTPNTFSGNENENK